MTRDESKHTGLTRQDLAAMLSYDYVNCLCLDMVYRSCDMSHPRSPMNSNPDLPDCLLTAYHSSSIDSLVSRLIEHVESGGIHTHAILCKMTYIMICAIHGPHVKVTVG